MMLMRFDRFKIKQTMARRNVEKFEELAKLADLSAATLYNTMDSYHWRSHTVNSVANALQVNPLDLITIDEQ